MTTLNYNLTFRLWKLKGNVGAKEGDHMYGSNFYYIRHTPAEYRAELSEVFGRRDHGHPELPGSEHLHRSEPHRRAEGR